NNCASRTRGVRLTGSEEATGSDRRGPAVMSDQVAIGEASASRRPSGRMRCRPEKVPVQTASSDWNDEAPAETDLIGCRATSGERDTLADREGARKTVCADRCAPNWWLLLRADSSK